MNFGKKDYKNWSLLGLSGYDFRRNMVDNKRVNQPVDDRIYCYSTEKPDAKGGVYAPYKIKNNLFPNKTKKRWILVFNSDSGEVYGLVLVEAPTNKKSYFDYTYLFPTKEPVDIFNCLDKTSNNWWEFFGFTRSKSKQHKPDLILGPWKEEHLKILKDIKSKIDYDPKKSPADDYKIRDLLKSIEKKAEEYRRKAFFSESQIQYKLAYDIVDKLLTLHPNIRLFTEYPQWRKKDESDFETTQKRFDIVLLDFRKNLPIIYLEIKFVRISPLEKLLEKDIRNDIKKIKKDVLTKSKNYRILVFHQMCIDKEVCEHLHKKFKNVRFIDLGDVKKLDKISKYLFIQRWSKYDA